MQVRLFRVDLKPTNVLLERQALAMERIAKALESFVEVPAQEPAEKPRKIGVKDIGTYGGMNETEESITDRLKRAGASDIDIEKAVMQQMFGKDDEE